MSMRLIGTERSRQAATRCCLAVIAPLLLLLAGCGYELRGRVIRTDAYSLTFVRADDPRLANGVGIGGARVEAVRNPNSPGRERAGVTTTDEDGWFRMPVTAFGAGFLLEPYLLRISAPGHAPHEYVGDLPSTEVRMLVQSGPPSRGGDRDSSSGLLAPIDGADEIEDIMREVERWR